MENPYTPPNETASGASEFPLARSIALVVALYVFVVFNYATSTGLSISLYNSFMHVVFLLAPISMAVHLSHSAVVKKNAANFHFIARAFPATCVLLSFALSWAPYFSNNAYEGFALWNLYFGPYGWMQWFWLIAIGILPGLTILGLGLRFNSVLILAHIQNAYCVWIASHLSVH